MSQADQQDIGAALQRVQSYQYPNTHIGHLNRGQSEALETFKKLCAQKGYYRPASEKQSASHDDETLLRYLRARKFIPQEAFGQFKDTEDWRKENRIDDLYDTIDVHDYEETRRLYPQWIGCRDKRGIPVYVFEVAHLDSKRMAQYEKSISKAKSYGSVPPNLMRLFALYENLLRFAMPLCSAIPSRPYPETPVSQSNNIVDISGVGLRQFWNLKQHMQDASQLATAHYPETLDRIFIIGAPSFFPTVWGWIKRWFDPITVSKIFILGPNEVKPTLLKYMDEANIPKKYGGRLDWEWGSLPNIEPAIANTMHWENAGTTPRGGKAFPIGPVKFEADGRGNLVAWAVGTENGKRRRTKVGTIPVKENVNVAGVDRQAEAGAAPQAYGAAAGWGTHPHPDQKSMPSSGYTPEQTPAQTPPGNNSPELHPMVGPTRDYAAGRLSQESPDHPRTGTSIGRYQAQSNTHAAGQLSQGTPITIDQSHSGKHTTYEPATIGQAPKDVSIPYRDAPQTQDNSYLGQAKSAFNTAIASAESAEEAVLEKFGYGHPHEQEKQEEKPHVAAADPRVDKMANRDVEDYLRSQYADYDRPGHHK